MASVAYPTTPTRETSVVFMSHSAQGLSERTSVLGIRIDAVTTSELFDRVLQMARDDVSHMICYVNAHCINQATADSSYRTILRAADLVYADGMGVVWASRFSTPSLSERFTLGYVLPELC